MIHMTRNTLTAARGSSLCDHVYPHLPFSLLKIPFSAVYLVPGTARATRPVCEKDFHDAAPGTFIKLNLGRVAQLHPDLPRLLMSRRDIPGDERREHVITLIECR